MIVRLQLLTLILLLASGSLAYAGTTAPLTRSTIGLHLGYAPDNALIPALSTQGGYIRAALLLMKQKGGLQYGLTVEGGTNTNDYWYLSPGLLVNHRIGKKSSPFYAGAMAGYLYSNDMMEGFSRTYRQQGYVLGVQGGFEAALSRRLDFSAQLAFRSTQVWEAANRGERRNVPGQVIVYFPLTVGIRYLLSN